MPVVNINSLADSVTPVGVSQLGTIVFDNVVFPAGTWIDDDGNAQVYNKVKLDAVSLNVNRRKDIVKSKVSGRKGTNKEYITIDDYVINLEAVIAPNTFSLVQIGQIGLANVAPVSAAAGAVGFTVPNEPVQLLNDIARLDDVQDAVPIRCKHLKNNFNITNVVIENFRLNKISSDTYILRFDMTDDALIDLNGFG